MPLPPENQDLDFPDDAGCFACSDANPMGLQLGPFRRYGERILARFSVPDPFHGPPGVVHGGIVATILDEVSVAVALLVHERKVLTGELSVRYRRPCPVEKPLELSAWRTETQTRYFVIVAEARDNGELLAQSTGKFFFIKAD